MTIKPLSAFVCLLLVPGLVFAQDATSLVPVACRTSSDQLKTPPPPDRPAVSAEKIDSTGRSTSGFFSIPEPPNYSIAQMRIADYADCIDPNHCYWSDLAKQTTLAQSKLKELIEKHKGESNLAMVLDIDDTSLTSYCEEKREGFGFYYPINEAWMTSTEASIPIPGTLALYQQAVKANLEVFFITGRNHEDYVTTSRNLIKAGYTDFKPDHLILRDDAERTMTATQYKSLERDKITAQHYKIILSVGDQWSDLNGTSVAEVSIKLPNPFYFLF